eukprot:7138282-Ditylum_brightwellii.AAC.1
MAPCQHFVFGSGGLVWLICPPPAAREIAAEELQKARHECSLSSHLFVVPCLVEPVWMQQLLKATDMVLELPVGPVPWHLKGVLAILGLAGHMQHLWCQGEIPQGNVLKEFWELPRILATMSEDMVWKVLQNEHYFKGPKSHAHK